MNLKLFKKISTAALLLAIAAVLLSASYFRAFETYELASLDRKFIMRPKPVANEDMVIIEIGEDSINKLGRFPFDRNYHVAMVKALSDFGAKAIIFDFLFSEPGEGDDSLITAIKDSGRVYMPFAFDIDRSDTSDMITAKDYMAKELDGFTPYLKGSGHVNILPDIDGKFRRVPLYIKYDGTMYPYMPFLFACDYLGIAQKDIRISPGKSISLGGKVTIPLDEKSNMIINYSGIWGKVFKHYSFVDILQSYFAKESGEKMSVKPEWFKDKVCVIGLTATGTSDIHPSPFEPLYPGVGIHAEVFNSVVRNSFIRRVSRSSNLVILLALCAIISVTTLAIKPIKGLLCLAGVICLLVASSMFLFNIKGLWIDTIYPMFAVILLYLSLNLYKYMSEWKQRLIFENELNIAKKIQESFLPKKMPDAEWISISPVMFTAKQVGGDMYDFAELSPDRLGIMIGDVSGKGVPASLFMAMTTGAFRSFAVEGVVPEEVLKKLNDKLVKESASNLFVTMFYAIFDNAKRELVYGNGGHLPLLYLATGKKPVFLDVEEGAPLGLMEGVYSGNAIKYGPGDIFIFYTDGVTEAMNSKREMYLKERLASVVEANRKLSPPQLLAAIEKDVRRFEPKSTQHDDMTIIVVKTL